MSPAFLKLKRKISSLRDMGPKRKKSKPNPVEDSTDQANAPIQTTAHESTPTCNNDAPNEEQPTKPSPAPSKVSTWSWRGPKSSPVTAEVAKESVSVAQGATTESSESRNRTPSSVSKSVRGSRKSIPLVAEASKIHATSDLTKQLNEIANKERKDVVMEEAQLPPDPSPVSTEHDDSKSAVSASTRPQSWFGWWSRPDDYASDAEKSRKKQKLDIAAEESATASSTPLPGTSPLDPPADVGLKNAQQFEGLGGGIQDEVDKKQTETTSMHRSSRSWFGLWSSAQNQQAVVEGQETKEDEPVQPIDAPEITVTAEPPQVEDAVKPNTIAGTAQRPKPSGWAFWSSGESKNPAPTPGGTQKQVGELAVADTPSQSNPEAAQFNEQRDDPKPAPKRTGSLLRPKAKRPKESSGESSAAQTPAESSAAPTPAVSEVPTPSATPPPPSDSDAASKKGKPKLPPRPNLTLPPFSSSFPSAPDPSYMERLTQYLAQSLHIPNANATSSTRQHVSINPHPPRIQRAVALGVHGFFPGALIQKVLGQPTGTSIRFANHAAAAIKAWCAGHQPSHDEVEVETVALEGEGFIADRVAMLWNLLLNFLPHLRTADFILVAAHSQGVPVATMLVAKLLRLGALRPGVRVGICAMAGINLGPFVEYKSRLFGATALELFDFADAASSVSKSYADSLEVCLRAGVRVTYVASIDDQLVPLESALHAPLNHPYVARAVFIDGRLHAPNFLTHLVVFALRLRNLGVSDHGLLRELSAPLAGSLVGGDGHSRIYDDAAVYQLAIQFALEGTDVQPSSSAPAPPTAASSIRRASLEGQHQPGICPSIAPYEPPPSGSAPNPFYLPWAVRGMLEEPLVKEQMKPEVEELVREFERWRPSSKVLRDVRWRLEGVGRMG